MKQNILNHDELLDLYVNNGLSAIQCAKYFGVSQSCIRRRLRKLNITIRPPKYYHIDNISNNEIVDLYWNKKLSIAETAKVINKSESFVKTRLRKTDKGTRSVVEGARLWRGSDDVSNEELIYLHDILEWSCTKISTHFGKSEEFVRQRFITIGKNRRKTIGKYSGTWKGGVTCIAFKVRTCERNITWRKTLFKQFGSRSIISGKRSFLHCHHLIPFSVILKNSLTKHKPLDNYGYYKDLAICSDERFYDLDNGLVITEDEHNNIGHGFLDAHPWWKIWKAYPTFASEKSRLLKSDFDLFDENGQIKPINYSMSLSNKMEVEKIIRYEHYLGTVPISKIILVAKTGNIIVGVATFGKGTNKNIIDNTLELTRLCIPYYIVRPFACEFLFQCCKYIKNNYSGIKRLLAYSDSSVGHNGGVYRMAGWTKAGKTSSSYAYFDLDNFQLKHKSCCRRIKCLDKTEKQLAEERGFIRIPLGIKYRYIFDLYK